MIYLPISAVVFVASLVTFILLDRREVKRGNREEKPLGGDDLLFDAGFACFCALLWPGVLIVVTLVATLHAVRWLAVVLGTRQYQRFIRWWNCDSHTVDRAVLD